MGADIARSTVPFDVFVGRGWDFAFAFPLEDFADVTAIRLGMSNVKSPELTYELTSAGQQLTLDFVPDDDQEAVGGEAPNGVIVNLPPPPSNAPPWVAGVYAFDLAVTRGDGSIDVLLEGLINLRKVP